VTIILLVGGKKTVTLWMTRLLAFAFLHKKCGFLHSHGYLHANFTTFFMTFKLIKDSHVIFRMLCKYFKRYQRSIFYVLYVRKQNNISLCEQQSVYFTWS
jgi:hypothetical protein